MYLDKKRILITGGTGSLGKVLTRRILSGQLGTPQSVVVFSRDEAKQHEMRMVFLAHYSLREVHQPTHTYIEAATHTSCPLRELECWMC